MITSIDLKNVEKKENRPIDVSVIKKEKPKPEPTPKPQPPLQDEDIHDEPIKEDMETALGQNQKVLKGVEGTEGKRAKGDAGDIKSAENDKASDKLSVADDNPPVELPKVEAPEKFSQEELDKILNPTEVIDKFASGAGGDFAAEDHVSMQYVKLKYQSYFYKFASRLYRVWVYPMDSVNRGEEGIVRISFVISRDGMISGIKLLESSGYPDLDKEAMMALKKTAGVPLPQSYEKDFLKVDGYFKYSINRGFQVY